MCLQVCGIDHHGRPGDGIHALQIEFDRSLYLDRSLRDPGPGFDAIARVLETLVRTLGEALIYRQLVPLAAE